MGMYQNKQTNSQPISNEQVEQQQSSIVELKKRREEFLEFNKDNKQCQEELERAREELIKVNSRKVDSPLILTLQGVCNFKKKFIESKGNMESKKCIFVIGDKNKGKSTLINHLLGDQIIFNKDDLQDDRLTCLKQERESQTSASKINIREYQLNQQSLHLIEMPSIISESGTGLEDTYFYYLKAQFLFQQYSQIQIILIIDENSLRNGEQGVQNYLKLLKFFFKEQCMQSIIFVITQIKFSNQIGLKTNLEKQLLKYQINPENTVFLIRDKQDTQTGPYSVATKSKIQQLIETLTPLSHQSNSQINLSFDFTTSGYIQTQFEMLTEQINKLVNSIIEEQKQQQTNNDTVQNQSFKKLKHSILRSFKIKNGNEFILEIWFSLRKHLNNVQRQPDQSVCDKFHKAYLILNEFQIFQQEMLFKQNIIESVALALIKQIFSNQNPLQSSENERKKKKKQILDQQLKNMDWKFREYWQACNNDLILIEKTYYEKFLSSDRLNSLESYYYSIKQQKEVEEHDQQVFKSACEQFSRIEDSSQITKPIYDYTEIQNEAFVLIDKSPEEFEEIKIQLETMDWSKIRDEYKKYQEKMENHFKAFNKILSYRQKIKDIHDQLLEISRYLQQLKGKVKNPSDRVTFAWGTFAFCVGIIENLIKVSKVSQA